MAGAPMSGAPSSTSGSATASVPTLNVAGPLQLATRLNHASFVASMVLALNPHQSNFGPRPLPHAIKSSAHPCVWAKAGRSTASRFGRRSREEGGLNIAGCTREPHMQRGEPTNSNSVALRRLASVA
jgi:hypothetical protein